MNTSVSVDTFFQLLEKGSEKPAYYTPLGAVSVSEVSIQAKKIATQVAKRQEQRWLLWADDAGTFLCLFCALCLAKKHIIMPGNVQRGTLATLDGEFDAALVDCSLANTNKDDQKQSNSANFFELVYDKPDSFTQERESENHDLNQANPVSKNNTEVTLFTSGTTGEAKAIRKDLQRLISEISVQNQSWSELVEQHTVISTVSHQHIYGLLHFCLWPFLRGAPYYTERHQYPEELMGIAERFSPCVLVSSPSHLQRFPKSNAFIAQHKHIRCLFSSTGLLTQEAAFALEDSCGNTPLEIFGSTETGGVAWRQQRQAQPQTSHWRALANVKLSEDPETGCLLVNSQHSSPNPFVMGDLVEFGHDGSFQLLGRADKIVKVEGKRLSINEIERRLNEHPYVKNCRIIVIEKKRQEVCAVVELNPDISLDPVGEKRALNALLKSHLNQYFERILCPRRWRYVDALPKDTQGKTTFQALSLCFEEQQ